MININEVIETNKMIDKENLDVRTITMGISLWIVLIRIWIRFVKMFIIKLPQWRKTWWQQEKRSVPNLVFRL